MSFKAIFLLCTLPKSWDISRTAISNLNVMLLFVAVESSLHIEEMNWQNNASCKSSCALHNRGISHREANLIVKALVNHMVKILNAIIVARRFTLNMIATNGRK